MANVITLKTAREGLARRVNELAAQQDRLVRKIARAVEAGDGEVYVDARSDLRDTITEVREIEREIRKLDKDIAEKESEAGD